LEKQIIAIGSGGFGAEGYPSIIDKYILEQCKKKSPKICFLPPADDEIGYSLKFFQNFSKYSANLSWLSLFNPQTADLESYLQDNDIIYVGWGNTKSMLALWREWKVDSILRKAYDKGTILCGISAGAICWFDYGYSDSIPDKYTEIKGLGILEGILNVHQKKQSIREKEFEKIVYNYSVGYGLQDNITLHFKNEILYKALSINEGSKGYIYKNNNKTEIKF
jgi:peptidase E